MNVRGVSDDPRVTTELADPSLFDWYAQIWIPLFVGLATVGVSVIALIASSRATKIAHQVESQREAAALERQEDDRRRRLLDMSGEEARTLHRYVVEQLRAPTYMIRTGIGDAPPARSPHVQAAIDARVALEQSLVPGAEELLAVTEFDLQNRWDGIDRSLNPRESGYEAQEERARSIVKARERRMFDRIRAWGLDPDGQAPHIRRDLEEALGWPSEYWQRVTL